MTDQPWFKHYDHGVPHSLAPYPQLTLVDLLHESASLRPKHAFLLFQGRKISYRQLERLSMACARALIGLGVKKGDRVALMLPNTPQAILALFGIWMAGGIAVPLNPLYTEHELEHALQDCGAETVLVLTPFYRKLKAMQIRSALRNVIAVNVKEFLPPVQRALFTLFKEARDGHRVELYPGDHRLSDLLRAYRASPAPTITPRPGDSALLLFSGGTTGTPKAALVAHHSLFIAGRQIRAWLMNLLIDWDDIIMLNMPLFHAYGLVGVFATGMVGHNTFAVVANPRDLDDLVATLEKLKPAFLPGVPTLFTALLNHPRIKSGAADLTSLRCCTSGASSLLAETKQRFEIVTGARIIEAYAMTESVLGGTMTPVMGEYKPGSIGIPLPDVEVRICDVDTGQGSLAAGEIGEILLRAPQVMTGYWNKPGETANILRNGWLYTGDIGYQDEDGYVFIVDRKKDLIKPGGFQVWPRDVEEVIAMHPAVAEVCVGGIPDPHSVEAVKAWVVLRGGQSLAEAELRAFCRERLAGYKVPRHIEFRESLPKSTVGKILRRELVQNDKS
jgi:long-chain acyl-CoA synthetase